MSLTETQSRLLARAESEREKAGERRAALRQKYPEFAAFVDSYRKVFGAELIYFREPGYEWRRRA